MAHSCNPSFLEDEAGSSRPAQGKRFSKPHLKNKKLGVVACACHPSYTGSISRRIISQAAQALT
jgi:hypothetical protein